MSAPAPTARATVADRVRLTRTGTNIGCALTGFATAPSLRRQR